MPSRMATLSSRQSPLARTPRTPNVLIAAGLLARKANEKGLKPKPWVKTSLAPGSQVVTDYLTKSGLQAISTRWASISPAMAARPASAIPGRSRKPISKAIQEHDLVAAAVLSGNRNFEGRVNPYVRANYLASPPLVVAYALAGTMNLNLATEPIGTVGKARRSFSRTFGLSKEIAEFVRTYVTPDMFKARYADVFKGDDAWQAVGGSKTGQPTIGTRSTYVGTRPISRT